MQHTCAFQATNTPSVTIISILASVNDRACESSDVIPFRWKLDRPRCSDMCAINMSCAKNFESSGRELYFPKFPVCAVPSRNNVMSIWFVNLPSASTKLAGKRMAPTFCAMVGGGKSESSVEIEIRVLRPQKLDFEPSRTLVSRLTITLFEEFQ